MTIAHYARVRSIVTAALTLLATLTVPSAAPAQGRPDSLNFKIRTLSTKPYLVSGGDVLVAIDVPRNVPLAKAKVSLNGHDITSAFRVDSQERKLTGLVTGLHLGDNELAVSANGRGEGRPAERVTLTNYPITGPIRSGPHQTPFICQTQNFLLPDGTTLGPATDANCSALTKINYIYMPVGGTAFKPLPSLTSLPADVSTTTTTTGKTVNFVVRVETSTIDRGIYQSAILHDPTSEAAPTWYAPPAGWNHRLIAIEGFGCPGGWYIQGASGGSLSGIAGMDFALLSPARLGEGYALFGNTLQHPSNNCNAVLSGEAAQMGKEHFIESYGVPLYTVSQGCSGGSYGSTQLADELPGLFQGTLIACTFPDPLGIAFSGSDGHLLTHYFTVTNPAGFTVDQQVAVSGYKSQTAWYAAANQSGRTDPVPGRVDVAGYASASWNSAVPVSLRYDPVTNPSGARPTVYDTSHNIYGVNPANGFALRPFDNVGVQYGLQALNDGVITKAQFLDLNARIGGYDQDANYVPNRVAGDPGAIKRAYESGLQLYGGGGLASIPVFDISGIYNDDNGYHYQWFHFAMRERMREANGDTNNHVMWRGNPVPFNTAFSTFIQWVEAVAADKSELPQHEKVARDKPVAAVDGCWSSTTTFIAEPQTFSRLPISQCNTLFPSYAFPRYVAGGTLAANIIKCHLKALDPDDYKVAFTSTEWDQLKAIFPNGVCDFSKPGVNQTGVVPWGSFGPSPVHQVFDINNP
jgi:Tannase-like family of unknown function (DUF6351)